jgi:acylphosphatase
MSARRVTRIFVEGRVQGVGYRAFLVREAEALGLSGWARNRADGSVEALLAGAPQSIDALIAAAWRGPSLARVDALREERAAEELLAGFEGFVVAATL